MQETKTTEEAKAAAAPAPEGLAEQVSRLEMMAEDDGETWDLSPNDKAAITAVLAALRARPDLSDDTAVRRLVATEDRLTEQVHAMRRRAEAAEAKLTAPLSDETLRELTALSDETLRELADTFRHHYYTLAGATDSALLDFARAVLARQQEANTTKGVRP